eukprot:TRINITY_DN6129_c0_g1_i1.p1 TRINITY_DN6129_c0_g1~~TRINITY_DN6129_c0_g1_i1.p1  ORF type:complete len:282 (+),score=61.44 TRINITY_DN6129_c0_g1_i1:640-1485(+)
MAALKEKKLHYQNVYKSLVNHRRESFSLLFSIFPILPHPEHSDYLLIAGSSVPSCLSLEFFERESVESVENMTSLIDYVCKIVHTLAFYLNFQLPYRMKPFSGLTSIREISGKDFHFVRKNERHDALTLLERNVMNLCFRQGLNVEDESPPQIQALSRSANFSAPPVPNQPLSTNLYSSSSNVSNATHSQMQINTLSYLFTQFNFFQHLLNLVRSPGLGSDGPFEYSEKTRPRPPPKKIVKPTTHSELAEADDWILVETTPLPPPPSEESTTIDGWVQGRC